MNYFCSLGAKNRSLLLFFALIVHTFQLMAQCPEFTQRNYATSATFTSLGGFISNDDLSYDNNPSTAAEITTIIGLAGMGGGYYDLHFDQSYPAGTPASIKIGKQYSGVNSLSGFLAFGLDASGFPIGTGENINPGILSLLSADSAFEFTFIPSNTSGEQDFSGVRIYFGAFVSVADTYKVYEAYVKQPATSPLCDSFQYDSYTDGNTTIDSSDPYVQSDVADIQYGVDVLSGLDALSATASVIFPWNAVDNNNETYTILNRGTAVLNVATHKTNFKLVGQPDDSIEIILSRPDNDMLQLGLFNGFGVTLYNDTSQIGPTITNLDPTINLDILNIIGTGEQIASLTFPANAAYDTVEISYGGVANVLDAINVHQVNRIPAIETVATPNINGNIAQCNNEPLALQVHDECTIYQVYDSNDIPLNTTDNFNFDLPVNLPEGTYTFFIQAIRQGCEFGARVPVSMEIYPTATNADFSDIEVNGQLPTTALCLLNNPEIILSTEVSNSSTITNPVFTWYDESETVLSGGNDGILNLGALPIGNYTYSVTVQGDTTCESEPKSITFTITDEATPTTANANQIFCAIDNPTVADLQTNETNVIWYDAPTNGNQLDPTTPLENGSYFAATQGATCESSSRLEVVVIVINPIPPTTSDTNQIFCSSDNPTLGDIQINEPNVIWYDSATNGNQIDPNTPLENGSYFATVEVCSCECSIRLEILVTVLESFATITGATVGCKTGVYTYTTESNMNNYEWSVENGTIIEGGTSTSDYATVHWDDTPSGNVSVTYYDDSLCNGMASASLDATLLMCSNLVLNKTVDPENAMIGDNVTFTITIINDGGTTITNLEIDEPLNSGFTYVSHSATTGTYDEAAGIWNISELLANEIATLTITVTINPTGDYTNTATLIVFSPEDEDVTDNSSSVEVDVLCFTVYNEFSPNNDGENEYFVIDCIENYPQNNLVVFNRWGNEVYKTTNYRNNWNGVANVSGVVNKGEPLPVGTYFYVFSVEEKNISKSGWLYIAR